MVAKIIPAGIEGGNAVYAQTYGERVIALSAEHGMVLAKGIATRILSEIHIRGSQQTLSELSANLNRARAILQIEEIRGQRHYIRFHG